MSRIPRSNTIDPQKTQIIHTWNRCVRRGYLCGVDPLTGIDYEHRRSWARERIEHMASCFAIEVVTFSIMSNHAHQVLRTRPDIVATWDDRTVAQHWLSIDPQRKLQDVRPQPASEKQINMLVNDAPAIQRLRLRLSNVSWWMRYFAQSIAWRANREDDVTGHFWESRFCHDVLTESASILACMIYVDLNPIRAMMAATPEESDFTGAKDRIDDLRIHLGISESGQLELTMSGGIGAHQWERLDNPFSGWLCPLEIDEAVDPIGPDAEPNGRRASRKGVFPMSVLSYLELLDWTGRTLRGDKRGTIPAELAPILERMGLGSKELIGEVLGFGKKLGSSFAKATAQSPALAECALAGT